jgi:hypothetical protein
MGATLPSIALSAVQMGMATARESAASAAQEDQAKAQMAQIRLQQKAEDRARQERLRRALATQRARFGAQGIGSSGSASAVLAGLASEAERQAGESRALSNLRTQNIQDQLVWSQRKNLLDASSPQNRLAFGFANQGAQSLPLL